MTGFSLCIEPVLTEYDFYDRIKIAAELGYDAIEFWDPADKDVDKIARLASENNIAVSICCVKSAWDIRMSFPAEQVVKNIQESVKMAEALGCQSMIGLSGDIDIKCASQKDQLVENLKRVALITHDAQTFYLGLGFRFTSQHNCYLERLKS